MSQRWRRMYVESVTSNSVVLEAVLNGESLPGAGLGIAMVTVVTTESTPEQSFWGVTGNCGQYDVIIRRVT